MVGNRWFLFVSLRIPEPRPELLDLDLISLKNLLQYIWREAFIRRGIKFTLQMAFQYEFINLGN